MSRVHNNIFIHFPQIFPIDDYTLGVYNRHDMFGTVYVKSKQLMCACSNHNGGCSFVQMVEQLFRSNANLPDALAITKERFHGIGYDERPILRQVAHSSAALSFVTHL